MASEIRFPDRSKKRKYKRTPPADAIKGKRFGRLVAIETAARRYYWLCRCDCGTEKIIRQDHFLSGETVSCGCYSSEIFVRRGTKHGLSKTPLGQIWRSMLSRCYKKSTTNFHDYGGRGIQVCDEWKESLEAFIEWSLANGYKPGLSIDRYPDVNGNYEPANCRWTTNDEQKRNTRRTLLVTYNGKTQCLRTWTKELGLSYEMIRRRLKRGLSVERAFREPSRYIRHEAGL